MMKRKSSSLLIPSIFWRENLNCHLSLLVLTIYDLRFIKCRLMENVKRDHLLQFVKKKDPWGCCCWDFKLLFQDKAIKIHLKCAPIFLLQTAVKRVYDVIMVVLIHELSLNELPYVKGIMYVDEPNCSNDHIFQAFHLRYLIGYQSYYMPLTWRKGDFSNLLSLVQKMRDVSLKFSKKINIILFEIRLVFLVHPPSLTPWI